MKPGPWKTRSKQVSCRGVHYLDAFFSGSIQTELVVPSVQVDTDFWDKPTAPLLIKRISTYTNQTEIFSASTFSRFPDFVETSRTPATSGATAELHQLLWGEIDRRTCTHTARQPKGAEQRTRCTAAKHWLVAFVWSVFSNFVFRNVYTWPSVSFLDTVSVGFFPISKWARLHKKRELSK